MFEIRFPDRGDDESEYGASRKKPRGSNRSRARRRAAHKPDFHQLVFEPLEPRVVFSASPFDSENFHTSDTTAPLVVSLVGNSPSSPTNASSLVYTLTFSEAVTGVDTTDFAFIASAGVTANSTFVVTPVSSSVYTVTVSGITGNGTLRLDLRDDGSIRDLAGNQLPSDIVRQSIGVGATPYGLALGDLNGDGKIDIVTEGGPADTVAVMLGNGDGTFGAQQTFALGLAVPPITFAIGDVDGDGNADILSTGANRATVLLGNGDGTFQVPRESGLLDWEPKNVSFGDFNADGKLDFVFAARYGSVQVAFGNGNGTFANPQQQSAPDSEAARGLDVDGDGKLDIVSVSQPNGLVNVLLGNGDGTFKPQQTYAVRLGSQALTAGDFNGDGKLDLATSNDFDGSISLLLGNGNGTFQTQRSIVAGVEPMSIRAGDFNGDGRVDLAFVNTTDAGPGTLKILLGNGDGTFFNPQTMPTGVRTFRLETGDFNGDGKSDIVVANVQDGTLGINLNVARPAYTGQTYTIDRTAPGLVSYVRVGNTATSGSSVSYTLTFNEAVTGVTPAQFFAVTTGTVAYGAIVVTPESGSVYTITVNDIVGDGTIALSFFDGVGVQDLAGNRLATESLTTQLRPESRITVFSDTRSATIADFNADGKLDIVSAHSSGRISVLLGNGDGTFQTFRTFTSIATADLVSGDFNADGKVDIAFRNNNSGIGVMLGVGDGTFQAQQTLTVGTTNYALTSGDFNNDGKLDLAVVGATNSLFLLRGNGNGTFLAPQTITLAGRADEVLAGDIDNDGKLDLVVNNGTNSSMYFLGGNGNGTFKAGQSIASGYQMPVLGDLNADGKLDLVLTTSALGTVRVLLGNGNGTFQALSTYAVGAMYANVIGDINGDGKADLVVARSPAGFSVLLGNGDGTLQAARTFAGAPPYYNNENVKLADLNGDGRPDLINPNRYGNTVSVWLNGAGATGQSFTIDHSGPALQSIARTGAALTNSPTVSYTVTFAEAVTGVGAADFIVATTGGLVAGPITVTPVSGSVYTVTFGVGSGDGTATLKLVDDGSIFDLVGNSLAALQAPATVGISGSLVNSILSGDFNGDGRDDLLLASGNSFVLRPSAGPDGSFLAPTTISPGVSFGSPIAADVNADGKLDLLFESNSLQMNVYAMLGNGDGTFQSLNTYAIGELTSNLAVGDVTGDGIVDIVTGLGTTIKVFQGNGNGTFKAHQTLIGVGGSGFLALRDLNGDGRLDIISSATSGSTTLNVFMAVDNPFAPGTTVFQTPRTTALAYPITGLATGDFDGDGKLDLAISNQSATSLTAHLYLGNGDGTFAAPLTLGVGANTFGILSGDFNADGELDLAVLDRDDGTISMLYGNGDATFRYRQTMYVGGLGATALGAGDFSGDGTPDLAVKGFSSAFYLLSLSAGGTFVGPTYTVDQTVPTLVSIERSNPTAAITNASTVTFTITFSEAVTGFDATDYFLNITFSTTYSSVTTTQVSASVYTVTVGGIVGYTSFSTLGITLNFDGTVKDAAGNVLDNSVGNRTLLPYQSIAIDARSRAMATADFNGDGKLDLVAADNVLTNAIAVALGNGDGTFKASQTYTTQSQSSGLMVVGDVDGDGKLDLVTMHTSATRGGVLLGNGNGTFKAQTTFTVGTTGSSSNPRVLALGDLNSDGKLDLVVANPGSGMLTVSFGNGNGTFQAQQSISLPNLVTMALGDMNADGKLDIVATTTSQVVQLLGNGNGTFQAQQTFASAGINFVALADFNGDGKTDVIGVASSGGIGSLLLGNGDGTFQTLKTFGSSGGVNSGLIVGDVNGDGKLDFVLPNYSGSDVGFFAGNGDGTFKARQSFSALHGVRSGAIADFNGDGKADVAVAGAGTPRIDILFGGTTFVGPTYTIDQIDPALVSINRTTPTGPTTTATTVEYTVTFNESVVGVDAADFQLALAGTAVANPLVVTAVSGTVYTVTVSGIYGDGTLGLNLANNGTITDEAGNRLWLLQRMPTVASTFGPVSAVVRGDLNADGIPDLVFEFNASSLGVSLGNGDGTFQPMQTFSLTGNPASLALDDLNADGKLDLVVSNGTDSAFSVLFGNGNGTFQARQTFTAVAGAKLLALRDLNGDGKLDLSFLVPSASAVGILLGNGDGTFQAVQSFSTVATPKSLLLADVDADGKIDLLVGSDFNDNTVSLFVGNGDGTFQARRSFAVGAGAHFVAAADVDGDGKLDLAVTNSSDHNVSLFLGNGDGTFGTQQSVSVGRLPSTVMLGDLTGDGKVDLLTVNEGNGTVSVLAGNGNGTFQASRDGVPGVAGYSGMTLSDLNGDGLLDLSGSANGNAVNAILGVRDSTFIGQTYTIDGRPTIVDIARTNSAGSSTNASNVQFTVTFSEAVTGVDVADFVAATTGTAVGVVSQVTPVSGTVYTVVVSGVAGEGTLGLNLVDDGSIRDAANNRLDTTGSTQTFQVQKTFATGGGPAAIAYGDFNGDGRADMVYSHVGDDFSGVRLGNGDGTFQAPLTFGFATESLAVADVNADGKLDVVELSRRVGQSSVVVFLGNGNGTFQSGRSFAAGSSAQSVVLKDLNADGKLDVALANFGDNSVGVLLGNGDGNFQSQQTYAAGNGAYGIAIGDVNGDGKPDLIAANRDATTASVLLGNGDGTFQAQQTAAVGDSVQAVATADFNGDGKLDLAFAATNSSKISILFGNGNGTFQTPQTYDVGARPPAIATADVDGDGLVDVVVVTHEGVNVFKSNGNGTFQARRLYLAGDLPVAGTVGDLNGDGRLDVAVTNLQDDTVGVLLGAASFIGEEYVVEHVSPSLVSLVRTSPTSAATNASSVSFTATFDEDMTGVVASRFALALDGVTASSLTVTPVSGSVYTITVGGIAGSGTLGIRLVDDAGVRDLAGNRLRSFQTQQSVAVGAGPWTMASGDFDRDGNIDLVVSEQAGDSLGLLFGNGDGTFRARQSLAVADLPSSVVVADFNGDGKLDLSASIAYSNLISVRLGNGDGTFQAERTIPFDGSPTAMKAADFNGDGKIDLAVAGFNTASLSVFFGNGDGEFLAPQTFAVGANPNLVSMGDLNGDGRPDLIVAGRGDSSATVLLADGDGFVRRDPFYFSVYPISLALGDFDGDGKLDLVKTDRFSGVASLMLGVGDGTFQQEQSLAALADPASIAAADLNGDGKSDLVLLDYRSHSVSLMLGNGDGTFLTQRIPVSLSSSVNPIGLADLNHDGLLDITFASYGDDAVAALLNGSGGTFTGQSYTIDTIAPTVTGIYARGVGSGSANWNASFLSYLATNNLGDATLGYLLSSGATQLKTLSWSNVNTISIRFSEELTIAQGDLSVIGAANGPAVPAITGFAWDAVNHVGTWTFAAALPRGKFLLHLGGTLLDTVGNELDGEWNVSSSITSGNGAAGGDFNFRFNVLPGDFDGNNGVTITEVLAARNRAGKGTASVGYAYREDTDGNGNITITEVLQSRNRTATSITGLNEPVAPGSTPQSPLELAPLIPGDEDGLYVSPYAALTEAELAPIVAEAIARWEASGLVPHDFDWSKLRFAITDLGPAYLGLGNPDGAILLDDDGAGWGWFVDGSPNEDGEFASSTTDAAAAAHMDLLTVVMHEIGHAIGYPTGSAVGTAAETLMSEFLGIGTRRTPGLAPAVSHQEPDLAPADLLAAAGFASAGTGPSLTNWSAAVAPSSQDYAIYALSSFTADSGAISAQPDEAAKPRANKSRRWP